MSYHVATLRVFFRIYDPQIAKDNPFANFFWFQQEI